MTDMRYEDMVTPPDDIVGNPDELATFWRQHYAKMVSAWNRQVESAEYQEREIYRMNERIGEMRDVIKSKDEFNDKLVNALGKIRSELATLFRKDIIKDIKWFNDITKDINGFMAIQSSDYYTAKAVISIDGMWVNESRNVNAVKQMLANAINNINWNENSLMIEHLSVEDLYDVEELTDTMEG